ncbi:hypothetical protein IGI04_014920 [Brassica rapa subsp. trilocularis]|uniref:Uncharacterized protein n=1 Tax=Brassica rapa subsp. trilocularis TaxID=1813537 RepID=A0ABQ7MNK1_BRACM|nr:hypothetical protein IGI04_014920 [Brassica rapa subsp. trilocularis]
MNSAWERLVGATPSSRSDPPIRATLPEQQGGVARVFITRRRENESGATSRSDTARSLPKPGATCRSDELRSLRALMLLELMISQGPFATRRQIIFVLRKTTKNLWKVISLNQLISLLLKFCVLIYFSVFLYMINLKSNMSLRGIMEISEKDMASGNRLSRGEKGKDIATPSSPARDADGSPLDEFDIIRLLVADAHRQFHEEAKENVGDEGGEASGSEAPSQVVRPIRRAQRRALRHPNTIAYPENHLRWPDLSREWIRRQQARIAREVRPAPADGDVNSEPPSQSSPKKKTSKAKKQAKKGQSSSLEGSVPLEEAPSSADASEVAAKKKKKKKDSKKRSREEASVEPPETSMAVGNDNAGRHDPTDYTRGSKKTTVEDDGTPDPEAPSKIGGQATETGDGSRDESPLSKRALSSSARKKGVESGGSLPQMAGKGFPDRVEFLYDETTPLVLNPLRCAELTRQIRGGTRELPPIDDLYFKKEYIDAAMASKWSDGSMNYLVEKYDSTLKQTMVQLGASEKLARTRLSVIKRMRSENKKASDKAAKEKEVLRVKFAVEDKLKSDRLAKKDALREKARLERLVASLEKEKAELEGERDAVVGTLVKERQRLRDSRIQEVTRERVKVQTAMADKSTRCFGRVKDYVDRLNALENAKSLYGQASGTKKCLEVIRDSGTEIPQDMIDIFSEQEKLHEAEVAKLRLDPFSEADFALSPLNLPSRFVSEELMGMLDPYGSNVGLIGHESASQLITSCEAAEDRTDEPMIDITSALSKRIAVPEGTAVEECSDKNDSEVGGNAIQEETGNVAAEDPVLVSSSEEREDDEGGDQEENRSSPALIEEAALNPSASDPPAQIEGLNAQVAEETVESLDPVVSNKNDQDTVA